MVMPYSRTTDVPDKLRVAVELGFDYNEKNKSSNNYFGDCIFCGKHNKLYINEETGFFDCKSCMLKGGVYNLLKEYYKLFANDQDNKQYANRWIELANDRQLDPKVLKEAGIVYDGIQFVIPIRNESGSIINFRFCKIGNKPMGLPTLEAGVFGVEILSRKGNAKTKVYLAEGEFDAIALRHLLEKENQKGIVLGVPGAGMWKEEWSKRYAFGRDIVMCYDNDMAGEKGKERTYEKVKPVASSIEHIQWPQDLPSGFDLRDFVTKDGLWEDLQGLIVPYQSTEEKETAKNESKDLIPITSSARPTFKEVLNIYKKHLHMTQDLQDAIRLSFAVVLSTKIMGDPLWVFLVAPPGGGKTLTLLSLSACPTCYMLSTLTPNTLVSGFAGKQGSPDPSLLPKINNKVLVIKDYTEILAMPKMNKDQLFGTLRGAFDGETTKQYGNGIVRTYKSRFNVLAGVTQQIYAERSASLGERFLMFHIVKGVGFDARDTILSAIRNVGKEVKMNEELTGIAKQFLEVSVNEDEVPTIEEWLEERIICLAQLVAMLRASVERDFRGERKLLYRPQHEMGTRLAKQFTKAMMGLALTNTPPRVLEDDYRILIKLAMDTCVGFNLEAIASLFTTPGQDIRQLSEDCNLAISTLKDQVDDLVELGAIRIEKVPNPKGTGHPIHKYYISPRLAELWEGSGLIRVNGIVKARAKDKAKIKVRRIRKRLEIM